jgi:predicted DNA-binding transcriptional regulator AlpA
MLGVSEERGSEVGELIRRDHLLDPKAVGEWLGVPISTLYSWKYRGLGPAALRIGKHLRYRRDDVLKWIDRQSAPNKT